ncbi:hypothetical protein Trydic_g20582 [Trypoxylus dichotomus]
MRPSCQTLSNASSMFSMMAAVGVDLSMFEVICSDKKVPTRAFVEEVTTGLRNIGNTVGFVENGLLLFKGKKTSDYYEEISSVVSEEWFAKTLHNLPENASAVINYFFYVRANRDEARATTSVFRKPTHIDRYLHNKSNHHPSQKNTVVRTLVERARRICSEEQLQKELDHLSQALRCNGYPENILTVPSRVNLDPGIRMTGK